MATVNTRTRKHAASSHMHQFSPYPADPRFGLCACGATAYMDPAAAGQPIMSANPCVALYGRRAEGGYCGNCLHLFRERHHDKTYLKCDLRKLTHGAGSDHRAKWEACAKYIEGSTR